MIIYLVEVLPTRVQIQFGQGSLRTNEDGTWLVQGVVSDESAELPARLAHDVSTLIGDCLKLM